MTRAQELAKQMMEQKNKPAINWDELKFKIENNRPVYFRFLPDAEKDNSLFFLDYKTYKLSDTVYVNYINGKNIVQKTLNALYSTGDAAGKALYSQYKGKENHNYSIVICDSKGNPINNKAKIWTVSSKKLHETIMSIFFTEDFIESGSTYFKVTRTGEKLETHYALEQFEGVKLNYNTIELVRLDMPLAFAKSDTKALHVLQKLNRQFDLGMDFEPIKKDVPPAKDLINIDDKIDALQEELLRDL